ncbi:hypothetical protein J4558_19930 [Leptolyngbya sp. 15MV]|nr:hypothetical protein J4558_19930 [Leptolyngbya sp. 15MV]
MQPIAVEDVAFAVAACLEREESIGEIYPLVGPEVLEWPEMLRVLRDTLPGGNRSLEPVGIPSELAAIQARVMRRLGLGWMLPFDEGMALMGGLDNTGSPEKARAHLGLEPRPFAATLRGYASQV